MGIGDEISLKAEHLFSIGGFPVTNTLLLSFVAVIVFVVFGLTFKNKIKVLPGKFQSFFEWIMEEIMNLMESVLGNRALAENYLPLVEIGRAHV